ncbi:skin secretory protein xP2-like [Myzus persicae]|uniref:skin secretory protein xP2-like n=1 Tax=Myzus persicae TaxID=13164 RepID=UPI000B931D4C|nr:skin secretory protein xP2-like [Myzus persicae]XP_022177462.1 skin secretory protein xP2-like [Myzus persicae]
MSDDQKIAIPVDRPDDCSAVQPSKNDAAAAACPVQPPKDNAEAAACPVPPVNYETEMSDVILLPKDDDAASFAPPPNIDAPVTNFDNGPASPPKEDASPASPPKEDASSASQSKGDASPAFPPKEDAGPASPPKEDAGPALLPKEDASPAFPPKEDAGPAPPPKEDAGPAPTPMEDDSPASPPKEDAGPAPTPMEDDSPASPPNEDAGPAPTPMDDIALAACLSPLPLNQTVPLVPNVEPECSKTNDIENADGVEVKHEIKHETIDLGNDTYFYDDKDQSKVGFDRGLEPDRIVGATEVNGQLMFLIAWKNAEIADLLEAPVIYKRCPQLAIQFFEARLRYCPNNQRQ